jgi:hydroxymethylpyrimidine pyrophosphatase-like HAD family hydrolase
MDHANKQRSIAVDFDGTLATYDGWKGVDHLGEPVEEMIQRVQAELDAGSAVTIFTARVNPNGGSFQEALDATKSYVLIAQWCVQHIGQLLPITHLKSQVWDEMWDDRAIQIVKNQGIPVTELLEATTQG